jgi:heavy metal efflux system protein
MIERILAFSVHNRWLVLLCTLGAVVSGAWSLTRLPIDAVPDITNVQVQINAFAPALSPLEIEKQVTFPLEVALAGIPGLENTWSFSRNGFAQVTAVFSDRTDIYFARQQVMERLTSARPNLPPNVDVSMGPISTGLGEVYWWSVEYVPPGEATAAGDGEPGWQSDGSYLTPEGERLSDDLQRLVYLRTVQDWIIRPQMKTVPGIAGADAIGGYVKQYRVEPDPARLVGYGIAFGQIVDAIAANNASRGANYIERNGEGYVVRATGRIERLDEIGDISVATRGGVPVRVKDLAGVTVGRELRTGSASVNGREVVLGTALMLVGGNSRTVSAAADAKIKDINLTLPPSIRARAVLNRTELVDATVHTVATNLALGALLVVLVLFLMLGNFRAALITAMVIPITMLITATGMLEGRISANLMSLGALDFGLIVDGRDHHCRKQPAASIGARASTRPPAHGRRAPGDGCGCLAGGRSADRLRAGGHCPGLRSAARLYRGRRQDVLADGLDGHHRACHGVCPFLDLRARHARRRASRQRSGARERLRPRPQGGLPADAGEGHSTAHAGHRGGGRLDRDGWLFTRLGQEFVPILDEKNIVMEVKRIPSASLAQSQAMQFANEGLISKFPQVAFVFSRSGTPDLAADPMPPSATDTYTS